MNLKFLFHASNVLKNDYNMFVVYIDILMARRRSLCHYVTLVFLVSPWVTSHPNSWEIANFIINQQKVQRYVCFQTKQTVRHYLLLLAISEIN